MLLSNFWKTMKSLFKRVFEDKRFESEDDVIDHANQLFRDKKLEEYKKRIR